MNAPDTTAPVTELPPAPSLELQKVFKSYSDLDVLRNVSLTVAPGAFVSLVRPSGCGNSTLLETAAGFMTLSGGRVLVAGEELTGSSPLRAQYVYLVYVKAASKNPTPRRTLGFAKARRAARE